MSAGGVCFSPLARYDPDMRRLRARRPSDPPWFRLKSHRSFCGFFFLIHPGLCLALMVKKKRILNGRTHRLVALLRVLFLWGFFYNIANIVVVSLLRQKIQTIRRR